MPRKRTLPPSHSVVADDAFHAVGETRADSKKRVVLRGKLCRHYQVYQNEAGQILLDPMELVPAREAWLYKNPRALASVRRGVKEAAEGRLVKLPSLAKHADEPLGD